jgi:hypothetical protein
VAAAFASGAFNVMAATDVAAEGMDFRACGLVVALQPPAGARWAAGAGPLCRLRRRGVAEQSCLLLASPNRRAPGLGG